MIVEKVRLCSKLLKNIYTLNNTELWDNCELES